MTAEITFEPVDFEEFHLIELPRRIEAGNGALAAPDLVGAGTLGLPHRRGARVQLRPRRRHGRDLVGRHRRRHRHRDDARGLLRLRQGAALVVRAPVRGARGYRGRLRVVRAVGAGVPRAYHGRPIVDPAGAERPADLHRTFTLDDDDDEIAGLPRPGGLRAPARRVPRRRGRRARRRGRAPACRGTPDDAGRGGDDRRRHGGVLPGQLPQRALAADRRTGRRRAAAAPRRPWGGPGSSRRSTASTARRRDQAPGDHRRAGGPAVAPRLRDGRALR